MAKLKEINLVSQKKFWFVQKLQNRFVCQYSSALKIEIGTISRTYFKT